MSEKKQRPFGKVITGKVRFSYANVFEPKAANPNEDPKYSCSILIPKEDEATIAEVKSVLKEVLEKAKADKFGGKIPANWKNPLRDGDEKDDPVYAGHYFINARSNSRPGVVDAKRKPILDEEEFYSGCFGRAAFTLYAFNTNGNKGVAAGLDNLQKLEDGERLSGGTTATDDFGAPEEEDDFEL